MTTRTATCHCGQFRVTCTGDPVRVSVCHCLDCQKRSGSSFAYQARWPDGAVEMGGETRSWIKTGDDGTRATFLFCPHCGSTVAYLHEGMPGLTAVAVGAFAEPGFPAPHYSVYESRKHSWFEVTGVGIDHYD